ncbi:hypothetical protein Tco_1467222 [Tanacetum coccineum]
MKVFPLSLADDARQWWIDEGDGKITTWKELVENFFCKFYPLSRDGKDELLEEGLSIRYVLAGKEIDKVGEVSIIWNPMCVVVMLAFICTYNTHSCS